MAFLRHGTGYSSAIHGAGCRDAQPTNVVELLALKLVRHCSVCQSVRRGRSCCPSGLCLLRLAAASHGTLAAAGALGQVLENGLWASAKERRADVWSTRRSSQARPKDAFSLALANFVRWELFSANVLMRHFYWRPLCGGGVLGRERRRRDRSIRAASWKSSPVVTEAFAALRRRIPAPSFG